MCFPKEPGPSEQNIETGSHSKTTVIPTESFRICEYNWDNKKSGTGNMAVKNMPASVLTKTARPIKLVLVND